MTTFLFPGQGAQTPSFLHHLPDDKIVKDTLTEVSDVLGVDILSLDTEEALKSTVNVQLTVVAAGVATTRLLIANGVIPTAVSGMSIGSFTAAITAGSISLSDAIALVKIRATLMENAYPVGYGMAAFGGLRQRRLEQLMNEAKQGNEVLYLCNFNAPVEFVATGSVAALDRLVELAKKDSARRAQRLAVSVISHCELLASVSTSLTEAIAHHKISDPKITYVGNKTARILRDSMAVADELANNVSHPVMWYDSTTLLYELGERFFIEANPGTTLTHLLLNNFQNVKAYCMENNPVDKLVYLVNKWKNNNK